MAFDLPIMQWISSAALTLVSITVAIVAVRFSYRSNFGWEPVILVTRQGGKKDEGFQTINFSFEFWNRRKYPIVLRDAKVAFDNFSIEGVGDWNSFQGRSYADYEQIVEPATHFQVVATVKCENRNLSQEPFVLGAYYFDPIKNEMRVVEIRGKFFTFKFKSKSRSVQVAEY